MNGSETEKREQTKKWSERADTPQGSETEKDRERTRKEKGRKKDIGEKRKRGNEWREWVKGTEQEGEAVEKKTFLHEI